MIKFIRTEFRYEILQFAGYSIQTIIKCYRLKFSIHLAYYLNVINHIKRYVLQYLTFLQ